MRLFNSLQIVGLFVAWPYLLTWLSTATFAMSGVAFWTAIIVYAVGFGCMVASVFSNLTWD